MNDLISRQAAIKAICEDGTWLESQGCTEITMAERKQRDADILSDLPSVKPLLDVDYIELEDRFGKWVAFVVKDMIEGRKERWLMERAT